MAESLIPAGIMAGVEASLVTHPGACPRCETLLETLLQRLGHDCAYADA